MKKTIGLVFGGASGEHEVSVTSATSILANVDFEKYKVKTYYINKQNQWFFGGEYTDASIPLTTSERHSFDPFHLKKEVDVIFPITHGPYGEDGHYQAIFELLNLPYVGSDVLASAISMDKGIMKDLFEINKIPQGRYISFTEYSFNTHTEETIDTIEYGLGYPCFIKPANLGSSVGISKARDREELMHGLHTAFSHDQKVVVEEFIEARELEIGMLGNDQFLLSAVGEITTNADFYDYEAKYVATENNKMIIPADIPAEINEKMREIAAAVVHALGVSGISRIDFFYDEKNNRLLVNEINSLPGFTKNSMYPSLFAAIGISYPELISALVDAAFEKYEKKKRHNPQTMSM